MKRPDERTQIHNTEKRFRARELGLPLGRFKPGKWNAITDVEEIGRAHV